MRWEFLIDSDNNKSLNTVGGITYELQVQLETRIPNFLVNIWFIAQKVKYRIFLTSLRMWGPPHIRAECHARWIGDVVLYNNLVGVIYGNQNWIIS